AIRSHDVEIASLLVPNHEASPSPVGGDRRRGGDRTLAAAPQLGRRAVLEAPEAGGVSLGREKQDLTGPETWSRRPHCRKGKAAHGSLVDDVIRNRRRPDV